jgi:hypothetical protein
MVMTHRHAEQEVDKGDSSSCPPLADWDSSSDKENDDFVSPPMSLPRRDVLSLTEYKSLGAMVAYYGSLSLHNLDRAHTPVLSPTPLCSTLEEILAPFDDDFIKNEDIPSMFSMVPEESSMDDLLAAFQDLSFISRTDTVPQVSVHIAQVHQYPMSISNALSQAGDTRLRYIGGMDFSLRCRPQ